MDQGQEYKPIIKNEGGYMQVKQQYVSWVITVLLVLIPQALTFTYTWGSFTHMIESNTKKIDALEHKHEDDIEKARIAREKVETQAMADQKEILKKIEGVEARLNALHPEISKLEGKLDLIIDQVRKVK